MLTSILGSIVGAVILAILTFFYRHKVRQWLKRLVHESAETGDGAQESTLHKAPRVAVGTDEHNYNVVFRLMTLLETKRVFDTPIHQENRRYAVLSLLEVRREFERGIRELKGSAIHPQIVSDLVEISRMCAGAADSLEDSSHDLFPLTQSSRTYKAFQHQKRDMGSVLYPVREAIRPLVERIRKLMDASATADMKLRSYISLLSSAEPETQLVSLAALGALQDKRAIALIAEVLRTSHERNVLQESEKALRRILSRREPNGHPRFSEVIGQLLRDSHPRVRRIAVGLLGELWTDQKQ